MICCSSWLVKKAPRLSRVSWGLKEISFICNCRRQFLCKMHRIVPLFPCKDCSCGLPSAFLRIVFSYTGMLQSTHLYSAPMFPGPFSIHISKKSTSFFIFQVSFQFLNLVSFFLLSPFSAYAREQFTLVTAGSLDFNTISR